jgi:hypothetical protein
VHAHKTTARTGRAAHAARLAGHRDPVARRAVQALWDRRDLDSGAITLVNVQAQRISCRKARTFAREFTRKAGPQTGFQCSEDFYCQWRGWSCRNDGRSGDVKHRCETVNSANKRLMVVKWVDQIN